MPEPRTTVDPNAPCLIGWAQRTWPKSTGVDAPEPLAMWERVVRNAAASTGRSLRAILDAIDGVQVLYTQSWPYDDPVARLNDRLGITPRHRLYSGIGGTTPQVLIQNVADAIRRADGRGRDRQRRSAAYGK